MNASLACLDYTNIVRGQTLIYSAGFNVSLDLKDTSRIDIEIEEIKTLSNSGCRVVILSHQGSYKNKTACGLEYIANYLSEKISTKVTYCPESIGNTALNFVKSLSDGDIALLGNTRQYLGEESGCKILAGQFAKLGDFLVLGGFSKAHREHSSNYHILDYIPSYLSVSFKKELILLDSLINNRNEKILVVLGGIKDEKITKGLSILIEKADVIIPGGIVLNNILKALGFFVGDSFLGSMPNNLYKITLDIVNNKKYLKKIYIPDSLIISNGHKHKTVAVNTHFPEGWKIVDFSLSKHVYIFFENCKTKVIVAGTPCDVINKNTNALIELLQIFESYNVSPLVMGGDTIEDFSGNYAKSTGGGASLSYLCDGKLPLLEKLSDNQKKFGIA
ncbi:MAG: phosphoglycerate kinase [Cellvibrionaceae bacterium]